MHIKKFVCLFTIVMGIAISSASHAGFWDKLKAAFCPAGNEPGD